MLRSLRELERYMVCASDGDLGNVVNALIDDRLWVVRYLVVQTGVVVGGRRVLISPISFAQSEWPTRRFHVTSSRDEVQHSPRLDVDLPVSRKQEQSHHLYYGHRFYWGDSGLWGMGSYPRLLATAGPNRCLGDHSAKSNDVLLRAATELRGYNIHGSDQAIGQLEDFLVDDETWEVRYLVIDTNYWWSGKSVLLAARWAGRLSLAESKVHVDIPRQAVKSSPEWSAAEPVARDYEARLHAHYSRPAYWSTDAPPQGTLPPGPER